MSLGNHLKNSLLALVILLFCLSPTWADFPAPKDIEEAKLFTKRILNHSQQIVHSLRHSQRQSSNRYHQIAEENLRELLVSSRDLLQSLQRNARTPERTVRDYQEFYWAYQQTMQTLKWLPGDLHLGENWRQARRAMEYLSRYYGEMANWSFAEKYPGVLALTEEIHQAIAHAHEAAQQENLSQESRLFQQIEQLVFTSENFYQLVANSDPLSYYDRDIFKQLREEYIRVKNSLYPRHAKMKAHLDYTGELIHLLEKVYQENPQPTPELSQREERYGETRREETDPDYKDYYPYSRHYYIIPHFHKKHKKHHHGKHKHSEKHHYDETDKQRPYHHHRQEGRRSYEKKWDQPDRSSTEGRRSYEKKWDQPDRP